VLVGLGVRELSVSPSAVPRVKAAVRDLDVGRCADLAREALTMSDADDVRKLVLAGMSEAEADGRTGGSPRVASLIGANSQGIEVLVGHRRQDGHPTSQCLLTSQ
jgi:hypothetical protein